MKGIAPGQILNKYLSSFPTRARIAKSRDICAVCRISMAVLYNWKIGLTPIPWVYLDKITEALGENIFKDSQID